MEPQIQTLLAEVPAGFAPTFEAKPENERIVGSLDQLDADTRSIVVGVHYFMEQGVALIAEGNTLSAAHQAEHELPGFEAGGDACQKNHEALDSLQERIEALQEKVSTLQQAAGPTLLQLLTLEPGERIAFRTEGITAAPPEPHTGLPEGLAELLSQLGGTVQVIGVGPGGPIDMSPARPESPPVRKRSILDRLRGQ